MSSGRITLVQQNDIHGQLEPHPEQFRVRGAAAYRRTGGLAAAATAVRRIRAEEGAVVFADCGDALHGTLPALRTEGAGMVAALNALGVDLFVPGNWEYAWGPEVLRTRVGELQSSTLACNVEDAATGTLLFDAWQVRDVGGVPVAFIGITSPIVPEMSPRFARGLRFPDVRTRLRRAIERVRDREGAALVVVLSHLGFAQDVALARQLEGVDVVLSGHTHNRLAQPVQAGGALIIQSGFSGSFVGRLDLAVERGRIMEWQHRLIELDADTPPDPAVQAVVDGVLTPFREELAEVVGTTETALDRMGLLETTMDNLITDAYRELTGADVAFSHGWRFAPPVVPGPITLGDLWAMVPTDPRLFTATLTGRELHALLEDNLQQVLAGDALEQAGGYIIRTSGMSVVFRPNNGRGTRIESIEVAGAPWHPDRDYRVVGAGRRHLADARERQELDIRAIDALRRYLAGGKPRNSPLTHRKFIPL